MPAEAGIKFGHYVLLRRIARGGMAEVFLAQQRGLEGFDRRVAIKRILPHLADSADFIRMFLAEAKLAAQLSHPNIVHIYEFGKVDHDYFIAMEYVDGIHAGQLMRHEDDSGPFPAPERLSPTLVARMGADAAAALHHAHELHSTSGKPLGLVHRDVSPANIMISYDGVVKLCDFGIAKAAAVSDQLTNPGQVKGKYAYMSPEQTVAQPLDGRSDVFSLAIVLWELLAGRFMVPRGDAVAAMRAIRDGKIEPIERVVPSTPEPLATAIGWALENRREKRATAADLTQSLEAFIKQSPELATSMQLAAWVRQRFPREATGEMPGLSTSTPVEPGTTASPGTVAAPGTVAGAQTPPGARGMITPHRLIGASRVAAAEEPSGPESGTSIFVATHDLIEGDTLKRKPFTPLRPTAGATIVDAHAAEAPTMVAEPAGPTLRDSDLVIAPHLDDDDDDLNDDETIERASMRLPPVRPSPTAIVVAPSAPRMAPSQLPANMQHVRRLPAPSDPVQQRRMRAIIAGSGLVGLALVSFLIALAAKGSRTVTPVPVPIAAPRNDATIAMVLPPVDAAVPPDVSAADAAIAAAPPVDANAEAFLEVSTFPPGGTVRVGDQSRVAPAQLVVQAGAIGVDAELDGYAPVHREETVEAGEHRTVEIAFTHKLPVPHGAALGRLSIRTSPYADVYENGKKIGETPFADRELPVGTHTLTFRNPLHPTVTKKITITANKVAKLSFDLP